eukprot:CAMPEP_0172358684 /NCGR_PEP_ID=MMETSP1060-20121228/2976_1 /TAXON_ID=37318 /ORGANISM="Pseudo-nitzschia pungens, Strain cf. cingulata" /LENGTH=1206 /DNA_ID=CAMNT_0013080003 /DNA_START=173 /DNA_END=3793 /DNA_ORIENTATION=-
MASSRWKRFAFFEKNALSLPSEVLDDLLPTGESSNSNSNSNTNSNAKTKTKTNSTPGGRSSSRRSSGSSPEGSNSNDKVSLVVTTAALPLESKPVLSAGNGNGIGNGNGGTATFASSSAASGGSGDYTVALNDMWSSVVACNPIENLPGSGFPGTHPNPNSATIHLPSQAQLFEDDSNVVSSGAAVDGLVLAFVTSRDTDRVHCFDVSVRCNRKANEVGNRGSSNAVGVGVGSNNNNNNNNNNAVGGESAAGGSDKPPTKAAGDLEDLDGWRGYLAPIPQGSNDAGSGAARSPEEHTGGVGSGAGASGASENSREGIMGIATCRTSSGHRPMHMACITATNLVVCVDPHLYLSCRRPLSTPENNEAPSFSLGSKWNVANNGKMTAVDVVPGIVAVGTDTGSLHVFTYGGGRHVLRPYLAIPAPPSNDMSIVMCKISVGAEKVSVFVAYQRRSKGDRRSKADGSPTPRTSAGVSCYDMPVPRGNVPAAVTAPSARHDLDGRNVTSSSLCDAVFNDSDNELQLCVARPDGLYTYSTTQKVDVSPIDGSKLAICLVPPPKAAGASREIVSSTKTGSGFVLVASTDSKSRRDAVDLYDPHNKLVAFHLLLSPGHTAIRAAGVTTPPTRNADGSLQNGRSSAVVFTSGGSLVTFTEKETEEKVNLLVQKNLYSAAIFVAYADPSYETEDITLLYRRHAEYLYRKGEFSSAIEQYIHTIGSLEPSHVIFRYLDAPKIPLLVKYLEELRSRDLTTPVHNELLRTCYLKLNDTEAAEAIAAFSSRSMDTESLSTMVAKSPKDALATICSFHAPEAAEALAVYGASLARLLPRETAGLVVSLCLGTFSPQKLAESQASMMANAKKLLEQPVDDRDRACDAYPVHVFAPAFLENPKILRLILTHCNRNKCYLSPSLRRTLLELTLAEWNQAKRTGDLEAEKTRRKEAIAALTDSHCREIGDYDALVIVQLAGFEEGELLLYERLQMGPMLLSRYAKDGSVKARRQMLAMCQNDPEISADVLGYFVNMVTERMAIAEKDGVDDGEESDDELNDILEDIQDTLALAKRQGVLPPVRIARILAGEGTGQFSNSGMPSNSAQARTVPLSVALDYVGDILDESHKEISRLKTEVEEYNQLCNAMEAQIETLLNTTSSQDSNTEISPRINVDEMYTKVRLHLDEGDRQDKADLSREAFWREMDQSEDNFQTLARFFAQNVIQ